MIHQVRLLAQCALFGACLMGAFFGNLEYGDTLRVAGAFAAMAAAKIYRIV